MSDSKIYYQPPRIAMLLIHLILPTHLIDTLLGDLLEEFQLRAKGNRALANSWFWKQSMQTSLLYFSKVFSSPSFVKKLNVFIPLCMFLIVILLITWLSNADDFVGFSNGFWDTLLDGKIHMALFEGAFWAQISELVSNISFGLLIDVPALLITTINIGLLIYFSKTQNMSALKTAIWGYGLMSVPYIWSVIYLSNHDLDPKKVGPIIAIGILTLLYMLLPVSYMVNKKLKSEQSSLTKNKHSSLDEHHK